MKNLIILTLLLITYGCAGHENLYMTSDDYISVKYQQCHELYTEDQIRERWDCTVEARNDTQRKYKNGEADLITYLNSKGTIYVNQFYQEELTKHEFELAMYDLSIEVGEKAQQRKMQQAQLERDTHERHY